MNAHQFDFDPAALPSTLAGRLFTLMEAAMEKNEVTSDDAVLAGEMDDRRQGDVNLIGVSVREAVRLGALVPKMNAEGERASTQSERKFRKKTLIGIYYTTPKVPVILAKMKSVLKNNFPKRSRDLFSDLED